MTSRPLRQYLAFGTGVGIEIAGPELRIALVKMRPAGPQTLATLTIDRFRDRPAADWGLEYAAFLKKHGAGHMAAAVLLPRREVIVRPIAMPGVAGEDLENALRFQMDALHPFAEEDAVSSWARIPQTQWVLVAISRRHVIDDYAALFAEAGVKVSAFTCSAAMIYSALRLLSTPPAEGFLAVEPLGSGYEVYGESNARPIFSASFDQPRERIETLAKAELRLPADLDTKLLRELLPGTPEATALMSACPRLTLNVNLLPEAMRSSSNRLIYAPTAILAVVLGLLGAGAAIQSKWEDRRLLREINAEIRTLQPAVNRVRAADQAIEQTRARLELLRDFQARSQKDLDALKEVTRLVPPPAFLHTFELTPNQLLIAGEAEQAAPLLKSLDSSPLFQGSEFTSPLNRAGARESFRIRSQRKGVAPAQ